MLNSTNTFPIIESWLGIILYLTVLFKSNGFKLIFLNVYFNLFNIDISICLYNEAGKAIL